jgi:hypothetical protein
MDDTSSLTERQKKWFATVKANFEAKSGRTLDEWVAIARTCPHEKPNARRDWLKANYGLGQNHAMYVLSQAFEAKDPSWSDGPALRAALWTDPASTAILEAVEAAALSLPEVVQGQRKQFTAFSRKVQFASLKPLKGGAALLGLGVAPESSARLSPARKEAWSERLKSVATLTSAAEVDGEIVRLLKAAWERA